jgi:hypothetical protein
MSETAIHVALGGRCRRLRGATINDLVKFATVKPDASAFRAIINFDALTFGDLQVVSINGAFHAALLFACSGEIWGRH